ncbi:hypothetical protein C1H46_021606 [Malus baccata]|uniref:Reverse transcriptase Ty1/copia-type domain-containing protein n=1 Tax=Malus baccata TaxID=106549 RepID=A0A540M1Z4_MALBA|nr:hypothetical protein C1H46_021606 [Malus baccata]
MIILLLLYVDDILIACQDKSRIQDLKMLSEEFDMKDLGAAQKILGMEGSRCCTKDPWHGNLEREDRWKDLDITSQIYSEGS